LAASYTYLVSCKNIDLGLLFNLLNMRFFLFIVIGLRNGVVDGILCFDKGIGDLLVNWRDSLELGLFFFVRCNILLPLVVAVLKAETPVQISNFCHFKNFNYYVLLLYCQLRF